MKTRRETNPRKVSVERTGYSAHSEISRLACELFEREGKPDGTDLDFRFDSESKIDTKAKGINK